MIEFIGAFFYQCIPHPATLRGTKQSLHMLINEPISLGYLSAACCKPHTPVHRLFCAGIASFLYSNDGMVIVLASP